jgi:hypothetical protein
VRYRALVHDARVHKLVLWEDRAETHGWFLFIYTGNNREYADWDQWYETIEEAWEAAEYLYGVSPLAWLPMPDPEAGDSPDRDRERV